MAKDKKEKSKLMGAFKWAAKATLSVAFGFAVLGAFDFILFHELAEGEFFMESVKDEVTAALRWDIPFLGGSIADGFYNLGELFGGPSGGDVVANVQEFSDGLSSQAPAPGNKGFF